MEQTIQEKIRKILAENGWEQWELAKRLKVDPSQVSRWLSGQSKPGGESYHNICEIYKDLVKEAS